MITITIVIIMTIVIAIIITIMKNIIQTQKKVITVIVAIIIISFGDDNSCRSYDWSYVLLTQAFLKPAFYNYE